MYVGLLLLLFEASHALAGRSRLLLIGVVLLIGVPFTRYFVWYPSHLEMDAAVIDASFETEVFEDGIHWRPEFTELKVFLSNPTDRTFEHLDVLIRPTEAIAEIAQITQIRDVTFQDNDSFTIDMVDMTQSSRTRIPLDLLATDAGYRVRCPRLAPDEMLMIAIALADVKWTQPLVLSRTLLKV